MSVASSVEPSGSKCCAKSGYESIMAFKLPVAACYNLQLGDCSGI